MKRKNNFEPVKKNQSSTQVLKTLIKLINGNYTMSELIEELNKDENEPVFNNSIISKYINTCKYCGIHIYKIHNRYIIADTPFGINISDREYELLQIFQEKSKEILSIRTNKKLNAFMIRLSRYFNKCIIKLDGELDSSIEEEYSNAALEERKIRLMLKTNNDIECYPISIIEKKDKKYFKVLYNNKEKLILIDRVSGIEIMHEIYKMTKPNEEVVFKLTGGLASRYEIRPHEEIVQSSLPEYITISNRGENADVLISRLMRYDSLCEIEKPCSVRNAMKKMIDETLANYGE